jgi:hypothetical protein
MPMIAGAIPENACPGTEFIQPTEMNNPRFMKRYGFFLMVIYKVWF